MVLNCADVPITLVPTGGLINSVDNGAGRCDYAVVALNFEDVVTLCGAVGDEATLTLENVSIAATGNGSEATVPSGGGTLSGNTPVTVTGTVSAIDVPFVMTIDPTVIADFDGSLPDGPGNEGTFGAGSTTATYADTSHILATTTFDASGTEVITTLTGLSGSVTFDLP